MKRGMDRAVGVILQSVAEQSRKVTSTENIVQVATISANGDEELGQADWSGDGEGGQGRSDHHAGRQDDDDGAGGGGGHEH
ncbi:hypothetical protein TcBrA4_0017110 [Trypanosoma cruzi]|nr:hypothetical protein TcBrA4_0017110 [Trypanosoma cruzi]